MQGFEHIKSVLYSCDSVSEASQELHMSVSSLSRFLKKNMPEEEYRQYVSQSRKRNVLKVYSKNKREQVIAFADFYARYHDETSDKQLALRFGIKPAEVVTYLHVYLPIVSKERHKQMSDDDVFIRHNARVLRGVRECV